LEEKAIMCDVCESEGIDWRFKVGKNATLARGRLYNVYEGRAAYLSLCLIHDIELFMLGEKKFINVHPKLAVKLASEKEKFVA
jgi:hypothetical protein